MTEIDSSAPAPARPSELRTFLIADIRGYTRFTLEQGDEAAARLAARFAAVAEEIVGARDGTVVELRGDEVLAVFSSARQALRAAVELQDRFGRESAADPSLPLAAGVGLDAGEAVPLAGGYRGAALNLAARLCSLAGPGEVLASEGVIHLAGKTEGLEHAERGMVSLKGFAAAVKVMQVFPSPPAPLPQVGEGSSSVDSLADSASIDSVADSPSPALRERGSGGEGQRLPIGGFLGALPSGPLVARQDELNRMRAAVDAVDRGEGRLIMLAGEPGIGKTRLAQEVTLHVRNRGFLLAAGSCFETRQTVPYYPFLDALAMLYGAAPASIRSQAGQRWPYLGRLLPEAGIPMPALGSDGQEEQERLFRAITSFVQEIAGTAPVALLLDDLHWADSASLELLQHLVRHTRGCRVFILGAYRDVEVGRQHPLERALRDLHRQQLVERVAVRRLAQEGTAALIGATFDEEQISQEFAELMHRHTEGNPFFTQEVLRALVERGDIYQENGRWERREIAELEVPESIRSAIGERLSRLSEKAQELLQEASVLGQTFGFDDLQAMGDHPERDMEEAMEEAARAGLVRVDEQDAYAFNHALTQQALYAELSPRHRRRLHLAAGEALERLPERRRELRAAELAWHFLQADDPERALPYTLLAGDHAAAVFAYAEAERHYRLGLELMRELGPSAGAGSRPEAETREKLGQALSPLGRHDEALESLEQAAGILHAAGDLAGEARVVARLGGEHFTLGTIDQGIARLQSLVEAREASGHLEDLAVLLSSLTFLFFGSGRYEQALATAERAAALARTFGDDATLARAEVQRGQALSMLGQTEAVTRVLEAVLPLAEAAGEWQTLGSALTSLGEAYEAEGALERAMVYRERVLDLAERAGPPAWIAMASSNVAQTLICRGAWTEARLRLERATDMSRSLGASWYAAYPPLQLGQLSLREGNWDEASRLLEESIAIAERNQDVQALRVAQEALAERDLLEGNPQAALARLEPLLDRPGLEEWNVTMLLPTLARAYLEMGDTVRAEDVVVSCIRRAQAQNGRLVLTDALRVQGLVLARMGRWDKAEAALVEAVSLAHDMSYSYAEARALYDLGTMYAREGDVGVVRERSQEIRRWLEDALTIFQRLGAKKDVERAEQALAELDQA